MMCIISDTVANKRSPRLMIGSICGSMKEEQDVMLKLTPEFKHFQKSIY